ncbi:YtpR family tRNA-binding protein [Halobacillus sp. H74]|uniref:YtpR family tRNA-binding protein n=1 Tax=Halobacillus sp. H74 TaxID=3457436 RepID=UPI003FCC4308
MDVYYNRNGVGDVLIIPIKQGEQDTFKKEEYGDVVKITDRRDGSLLGYNIFNASKYFDLKEQGKMRMTEEMLAPISDLFTKNQLDDVLDFDLEPKFVVGYVKEKGAHENADKLSVCHVDVGEESLQIVCGAPNIEQGQKVVVAKVGAVMPGGMEIKDAKLRGVPSTGMICSAKELNLPDAPQEKGILVLEDHYEAGQPFEF